MASLNPESSAWPVSGGQKALPRILVIDDDPDITWLIKVALAYDEVEVIREHDGQKGVLALLQAKPDLIILDLEMPRRDGHDVIQFVRANHDLQKIPIVVLTGSQDSNEAKRVENEGANTLLKKPLQWTLLRQELERWLPLRRSSVAPVS